MNQSNFPSSEALEKELKRVQYRSRYNSTLKSTIFILITAAAAAALVAMLWLPVLEIYGTSMTPTLYEGEYVVSIKSNDFEKGDVIAFYYGNKLLVKRYIAGPGTWVDIAEDGTIYVDGEILDEPYISEKSFGDSDLVYPYQVPERKYFLVGDHRESSVDSRHSVVGCISDEDIVGKIIFRIWPFDQIGKIR